MATSSGLSSLASWTTAESISGLKSPDPTCTSDICTILTTPPPAALRYSTPPLSSLRSRKAAGVRHVRGAPLPNRVSRLLVVQHLLQGAPPEGSPRRG